MDYQLRQKSFLEENQHGQTREYQKFRIQSSKKSLIRQTDFYPEQTSLTDRTIHNQTQQFKAKYKPHYPTNQSQAPQSSYQLTDRTASYTTGASQYQFLIYENKIHLLTDRLQCYMDEVENLKKTNTILISKLSTIETLDEQLQNQKLKNLQLREQIETYRDKLQDEKDQYQVQIDQLKTQLQQKDTFIELVRNQNNKIIKKKDQQLILLKDILKEKSILLESLQKQIHNLQIQRLNTSDDFSRDSLFTRNSTISQYNIRNSQNSNNMHQSTISVEEKARQFVKKNQTQLKIAMKSISHAQKCLQIGGQQISTIIVDKQNQKSVMNLSRLSKSKINKTYYK